jgi:hypothetical protein
MKTILAILILVLPLAALSPSRGDDDLAGATDAVWNSMVEHLLRSGPDGVVSIVQWGQSAYTLTKVYPDHTFSLRRDGYDYDVCQATATRSWCTDFHSGRRHSVFELRNGQWVEVK